MKFPDNPLWLCNIGNTNTAIALWDRQNFVKRQHVPSQVFGSDITMFGDGWEIVVCSVAQSASARLHSTLADLSSVDRLHMLSNTSDFPSESNYTPGQAGADRLANVAGCLALGMAPCLAVDAGTAITVDLVGKSGQFMGGAIMPGLRMAIEALHGRTEALPLAELRQEPALFPASNTEDSITAGVFLPAGAGIERMAQDSKCSSIVLTGGAAPALRPYLRVPVYTQPDLTFLGMLAWYQYLKDSATLAG